MKPQLLRDTDPDKVRYKNLVDSIGKSNLHALFPNDFEDYFIALELVDSKKVTEAFVTFPVNPNSISESQPVLTNIKKTAGGIVSVGVETFVPRDIEIKGNFGRNLKIQIGNNFFIGGLISFVRNNDTTEFGRPSFSTESKTGYGVLKSLERILDDSEKLDSFGKPKRLYLYNSMLGNNYIVKKKNFISSQNISENMIPQYTMQLTAVSPLTFVEEVFSLGKSLVIGVLDRATNSLAKTVKNNLGL